MIAKAYIKEFILGAALAVLASALLAYPGVANIDILGGSLIKATPFDSRIDSAGAFGAYDFSGALSNTRSGDELFLAARSIRYVSDGKVDHWQTPQETQTRWSGDCEDKAIWLYAELKHSGYSNVRLVVGRYRSVDKGFHVWVSMADGQGGVYILDPTAQKKVWKSSDFAENYYRPLYSFDGFNRYRH
jgi:hypothetical protein